MKLRTKFFCVLSMVGLLLLFLKPMLTCLQSIQLVRSLARNYYRVLTSARARCSRPTSSPLGSKTLDGNIVSSCHITLGCVD